MKPAAVSPAFRRMLADHAGELLFVVDAATLAVSAANRTAHERLGFEPGDLVGVPITDVSRSLADIFFWEEVRSGRIQEIEDAQGLYMAADGTLFPVEETIVISRAGGRPWLVIRARDISRELREREDLENASSLLRATLESTADGILVWDQQGRIANMNQRFAELWRLPEELLAHSVDREVLGHMASRFARPSDYLERLRRILEMAEEETEEVLELKDGQTLEQLSRPRYVEDRIAGRVFTFTDISERRRAEAELRIAAKAFESMEAIVITDGEERIIKVNPSFSRITGYDADEAIGRTPAELLRSGRHDSGFYRDMWESLARDDHWRGEIWNRRKDGEVFPEWLTISVVKDDRGRISNYVAAFSDMTSHKKAEEAIYNLAFYDPLTELPNRRLLIDRLSQTLATSGRNRRNGAVLIIDLDRFKELNDTKGHGVGDLLLVEVAKRLKSCVRADDTVARLGGDEFVVVLVDLSPDDEQAAAQAEGIAEKIRAAVNSPFLLKEHEYHGSPSIGISLFRGREFTLEEILKRADTAMYQAKRSGRNAIRFFDPVTHAAMEARIALDADLRRALPDDQLRLYFQVQVDQAGEISSAEVLLRWAHPTQGIVSPLKFIPLAEDTGLIVPVGHWVLRNACARLKAWEGSEAMRDLALSINVSPRQFRQDNFVEQVLAVIGDAGINPRRLKFELTESLVLENVDDTIAKMHALKAAGVGFSMDDFGTGYSSLAYMSRLPLEEIKIDQSFVRHIGLLPADEVIVQTIIGMADNLGLSVIAEGVETVEQRDFLKKHGCRSFQGYLFGRPEPLEDFVQRFGAR